MSESRVKTGPKPKYKSLVHAIESNIELIPFSGCWIWTASIRQGYGQLTYEQKNMSAHRASFIAHNPDKPYPKLVCHHCDVRACVNPEHLYSGDYKTNRADMLNRERWKHPWGLRETCAAGHSYENNFYISKIDGSRVCRQCQREAKQIQRSKK